MNTASDEYSIVEYVEEIEWFFVADDGTLQRCHPKNSIAAKAAESTMSNEKATERRREMAENFVDGLLEKVPSLVQKKLREKAIDILIRPADGYDERGMRLYLAERLDEFDGLPGCAGLALIAKLIAPADQWVSPLAT